MYIRASRAMLRRAQYYLGGQDLRPKGRPPKAEPDVAGLAPLAAGLLTARLAEARHPAPFWSPSAMATPNVNLCRAAFRPGAIATQMCVAS
jgi:hypothetical protein